MSAVAEQPMTPAERQAEADDCAMQISRLAIEAKLLAPEAKTDPEIATELKDLESQREATEDRLAQLIREQREERQAVGAAAEAEAERRAEHLARARELGAERQKLCQAIDAALATFASLLANYHQAAREQADELTRAGGRMAADAARPRARCVNAAMRHALIRADVPSAAIELPHLSGGRIESLAEGDPVAIEPAGDES